MPEGHATHGLALRHHALFVGQRLEVTSPQGRFEEDANKVSGRKLKSVTAAGKHVFYEFQGGRIVHVHLGRFGKVREFDLPAPVPFGIVRMRAIGKTQGFDLRGPTRCTVISRSDQASILARLGPDPLASNPDRAEAKRRLARCRKSIGAALLDQSIIAGVGNIFRAEALFELRMDPMRTANELSAAEFAALWQALRRMMKTGLRIGRIVTVHRNEADGPLAELRGLDRFRVYRRPRCPRCSATVQQLTQAGRALYFCPRCQQSG